MVAQLNLSFDNLCYQVRQIHFPKKSESKQILNGVSGEFLCNELSAVIGVSGGGKSSLLDILSGFRYKNVTGSIKINENEISTRLVRKVSSYIMQENNLHGFLTVTETMMFAENFKRKKDRRERGSSEKILESLNMREKSETFVMNLSGGEQKRLSIAIELVDDPSIIFLDEPTTGLDSSSSKQCIKILKNLATEGRTVICSIHAPSASMFGIFDHVYALAEGNCIYQGSVQSLVPFLKDLNLDCPENYSPSDFLLEVSTNDYGPQNDRLIAKIQNGKNFDFRQNSSKINCDPPSNLMNSTRSKYMLPFDQQVKQVIHRNFLISTRNKTLVILRIMIHLVMGIVFGFIYKDTGQEASRFFDNYRYIMVTVIFQLYMSYFSLQTTIPLEFPILKRERFNRWYSASAYFTALVVGDFPITFFGSLIYVSITYLMTNQPRELGRFMEFASISVTMCYAAQGIGLAGSALLDVKSSAILAGFVIAPFFVFSSALLFKSHTQSLFHWLYDCNFLDNAIKGTLQSIYGNRSKIPCDEDVMYCPFSQPNKIIELTEALISIKRVLAVLIVYAIGFRIITWLFLRIRLKYL